ncbi:MAG TPA: CopD family protein [Mycobacteriales bacterium]|nr:CopD family protein [Mycobacteriales bacterium]
MAELPVEAPALRLPPAALRNVGLLLATSLLAASLAVPPFGLYAVEGVALVCAVAAAGLAFFTALLGDPTDGQVWWGAAVRQATIAGFAATLLTVAFSVMDVAGEGLRGLGSGLARDAVLRGAAYETALARCAGLCLVAAAFSVVRLTPTSRRLLMFGGGALVSGSFLLAGHARSHGPTLVVLVCLFAHVVAACAWVGGLAGLGVTLHRHTVDPARRTHVLVTFAGLMTGVIVMLLAGGVGLAALYVSSWHALVSTAYGQVLIIKVGLVAAMLVVSATNHFRHVRPAAAGDVSALAALRMNVAIEQIGLIAVLVVTEVLLRQNPVAA